MSAEWFNDFDRLPSDSDEWGSPPIQVVDAFEDCDVDETDVEMADERETEDISCEDGLETPRGYFAHVNEVRVVDDHAVLDVKIDDGKAPEVPEIEETTKEQEEQLEEVSNFLRVLEDSTISSTCVIWQCNATTTREVPSERVTKGLHYLAMNIWARPRYAKLFLRHLSGEQLGTIIQAMLHAAVPDLREGTRKFLRLETRGAFGSAQKLTQFLLSLTREAEGIKLRGGDVYAHNRPSVREMPKWKGQLPVFCKNEADFKKINVDYLLNFTFVKEREPRSSVQLTYLDKVKRNGTKMYRVQFLMVDHIVGSSKVKIDEGLNSVHECEIDETLGELGCSVTEHVGHLQELLGFLQK